MNKIILLFLFAGVLIYGTYLAVTRKKISVLPANGFKKRFILASLLFSCWLISFTGQSADTAKIESVKQDEAKRAKLVEALKSIWLVLDDKNSPGFIEELNNAVKAG